MLIDTIQQELSSLYVWLLANKLSLNLSKTHFMVFHRARHKQYKIHIEINKVPIEQVKHTQFLGVIFDGQIGMVKSHNIHKYQNSKGSRNYLQSKKILQYFSFN